jgi:peptidoglycan LD-endopeptidase CwlK
MPGYSLRSRRALDTCHKDLRYIFNYVIRYFDHSVIEGHRNEEKQNKYYKEGKSKLRFPKSKHNSYPSMAVDAAPYPINWGGRERFTYFAGFVMAVARVMYDAGEIEHLVRWGGDWDKDTEVDDNRFDDLPHFELYKPVE